MDPNEARSIMAEAGTAAAKAAEETFRKLEANGPAYTVHNADILTGAKGPAIGTMLDLCGGAWIRIKGTSPLVRVLKKIGRPDGSYPPTFEGDGWRISKDSYAGGYHLGFSYRLRVRQEASVHENAMTAAAEVLKAHGISAHVHTYLT